MTAFITANIFCIIGQGTSQRILVYCTSWSTLQIYSS